MRGLRYMKGSRQGSGTSQWPVARSRSRPRYRVAEGNEDERDASQVKVSRESEIANGVFESRSAYLVSILLSHILGKSSLVVVLALELLDLVGVGVGEYDLLLKPADLLSGINLAL